MTSLLFTDQTLHFFVIEVLSSLGLKYDNAAIMADHLVKANLEGHDSHGVHRLSQYATSIKSGKVDLGGKITVIRETLSTAVLDGSRVLGQVSAKEATIKAVEKAESNGTAVVTLRNTEHIGRAGVYAADMAMKGLVGLVFCSGNGAPFVAPWGSIEGRLSTNPIAVGIPTTGAPLILDLTTSAIAEGKIQIARNAGESLPEGVILDGEGNPSINPHDLYNGGTMLPLGGEMGHKGYGLSIVVDLLGALLGGGRAGEISAKFTNSASFWALNPNLLVGNSQFFELQKNYFDLIKSSAKKPGVTEVLLPGERELQIYEIRKREGVPVDTGSIEKLDKLASQCKIRLLSKRSIAIGK